MAVRVGFEDRSRRFYAGAVLLCVVIGLSLRAWAAAGDAWLDEIWSWQIARSGEVLVAHDNNHLLNTLWLWIWRDVPVAFLWRLPAVMSGAGSVALAAMILRRLGRTHAIVGALLIALSWPLVVYQSEARGYGLMLLCVFASVELQLRLIESTSSRKLRIAMALVAIAGTLSHLSFAIVYAIVVLAGLAMRWKAPHPIRQSIFDHAMGVIVVTLWLATFGRQMSVGGGPELDATGVLWQTLASIGGVAWLAPALVIGAIAILFQKHRALIGLLALVAIAYPILIWLLKDRLLYLRYFLPMIAISTLLLAAGVGELLSRLRWRIAGASLLVLLMCLHVARLHPLLVAGRDQHAIALERIAMGQARGVTLASDSDFQLKTILAYHERKFTACAKPILLHPAGAAQWWIVMKPSGPARLTHAGSAYELRASYNAFSLSGIPWLLYERTASAPDWRSAQTRLE